MKAQELLMKMPVAVQNLAISMYGVGVKRARYGTVFQRFSRELAAHESYSKQQLIADQNRRLGTVLTWARAQTPYYRDTLSAHRDFDGVTAEDLPSILPIVEKQLVRADPQLFYASTATSKTKTIFTSGTSGSPLVVKVSEAALQKNYAFYARALAWFGLKPTDRHATFAGRVFLSEAPTDRIYWRRNFSMRQQLFSSYHVSEETLPYYLRQLEKWQPAYIDSYPSVVYQLALHINASNVRYRIKPRAILVSSETLLQQQRAEIEKAFDCPIIDQYGNAEMVAWANQCEHGSMHLSSEYGIVELVDAQGKKVPAGEIGEMVCTGFSNDAMALLRYRIGDSAILSKTPCRCGRAFPVLEHIVGRTDGLIVTPTGKYVGRMDPVFKGVDNIVEAQIVQRRRDLLAVNLVPATGFSDDDKTKLIQQIKGRVGSDMHVEIILVEHIPRTAAGKFQSVVALAQYEQRGY